MFSFFFRKNQILKKLSIYFKFVTYFSSFLQIEIISSSVYVYICGGFLAYIW